MSKSYAQAQEDHLLSRVLYRVPPGKGCYIDVGAYHPTIDSVTRIFYDKGWRGINIEPARGLFARFPVERADEVNLQVAVSDRPGATTFYEFEGQLSTLEKDVADRHVASGMTSDSYTVPTMTLTQVCEQYTSANIHFLKVDVEGHEAAALRGMNFDRFRPWILVIESVEPNRMDKPTHEEWEGLVLKAGYVHAHTHLPNRYYVASEHPSLISHFEASSGDFQPDLAVQTTSTAMPLQSERQDQTSKGIGHVKRNIDGTDTSVEEVKCFLSDRIGRCFERAGVAWIAIDAGLSGHISYGPYEERLPGNYVADFDLALVHYPAERLGDSVVAIIDVVANDGTVILARRQIRKAELEAGSAQFSLRFQLAAARRVEYRVMSTGQGEIGTSEIVRLHSVAVGNQLLEQEGRLQRAWNNEASFLDGYLRNVSGVIHIGANVGQERVLYEILGLDVLWIEAMQDVYEVLLDNIASFRRQRAVRALLTDKAGEVFSFNVSNGTAGSSSILEFDQHAVIMPGIQYVEKREITSTTFNDMVRDNGLDLSKYKALCLDVEGSELLVLKSMGDVLKSFDYIKCEVSDFSSRFGAPTSADLDDLLKSHGFEQLARRGFGYGTDGNGTYWDILWKRKKLGEALFFPDVKLPFISNDESAWDHRMEERLSRYALLPTNLG